MHMVESTTLSRAELRVQHQVTVWRVVSGITARELLILARWCRSDFCTGLLEGSGDAIVAACRSIRSQLG